VADSRLDELRRRLEKDPGSRLFAQLAEQLRKEGELEEAIGVARAGLEKHPTYPSARLTLGRALLDSGDATAARAELDAAVQGAPDNILASRVLAETLETLGELKAAVEQFRATLVMAPGDAQIEGRIKGIEEQLATPATPSEASADLARQDHTKPMKAVTLDDGAAAPGPPEREASVLPGDALDDDDGGEEEEDGALPPTIRIHMPGDPAGGGRAPMPPIPGSSDAAERERAGGKSTTPEASVAETTVRPAGETAHAEPQADVAPNGPAEAGGRASGDEGAVASSDQAPTLPGSKAAEYAGADELPPTVPPGLVTTPDGLGAQPQVLEEPKAKPEPEAAAAGPEVVPGSGSLDFVTGDVARGAAGDVTKPPLAPEVADTTTPPVLTESPESTRAPLPSEPASPTPAAPEAPAGGEEAGEGGGQPLSSATLAELYLEQGLLERAIEVYREVLEAEPANDGARARLVELEASLRASVDESPTPAGEVGDERVAKRQALERTIGRLEALLAIVQRR
jgi:tetratricopeptide (TPR) repeat protein